LPLIPNSSYFASSIFTLLACLNKNTPDWLRRAATIKVEPINNSHGIYEIGVTILGLTQDAFERLVT
jgi:hypothetical protein